MRRQAFLTQEDFLEAYDAYADVLFCHCLLRIADRERSKELLTEAFHRLWDFIARGNMVDSFKIFLYRELNQLIIDGAIQNELELKTAEIPIKKVEQAAAFLVTCTPLQRLVFVLHFIDGFSPKEIESIIGGSRKVHSSTLSAIRIHVPTLSRA